METVVKNALRVLIVDDEPDIALILKLQLEDDGYQTIATTHPADVYDLVPSQNFALALVDIKMPEVTGIDILKYISEHAPHLPVIMLSAFGSEDIAIEAMKIGAIDYISKPFSTDDMLIKVERAIEQAIAIKNNIDEALKRDAYYKESVIQLELLKKEVATLKGTSTNSFIKSIEFDEHAYQAGVSILSYFSTIVKQKYPRTKVKVRIEQEERIVRLIVETPTGQREEIERTLEEYGLVVIGELQPRELLPDKIHEMQLRHKLEIAVMEVSHTKELLAFAQETHKREIIHITDEVNHLKEQIREAFRREAHSREVLLKIIEYRAVDGQAKDAVLKLSDLIEKGIADKDKEIIFQLLSIIRKQNKCAFDDIKAYLLASIAGASGNLLSNWLPVLFAAISS